MPVGLGRARGPFRTVSPALALTDRLPEIAGRSDTGATHRKGVERDPFPGTPVTRSRKEPSKERRGSPDQLRRRRTPDEEEDGENHAERDRCQDQCPAHERATQVVERLPTATRTLTRSEYQPRS